MKNYENKGNTKQFLNEIKEHFLSFYEDNENPAEALLRDADACGWNYSTAYEKGCKLAEAGCFLVYQNDVDAFLDALYSTHDNMKYTDEQKWARYLHLAGRAVESIKKDLDK